jgi:hypothetical protein
VKEKPFEIVDAPSENTHIGDTVGPFVMMVPLYDGTPVEAVRCTGMVIAHALPQRFGVVALTCDEGGPALYMGMSPAEMRHIAAALCQEADVLDGGSGKQ